MKNSAISIPQSKQHLSFLDGIRGFAIMMVFGYHALGASYGIWGLKWNGWKIDSSIPSSYVALSPITLGFLGVAIFFVVSGFCIHLSHEKAKRKDLKVFFVRRFFRIYPPYFLALCLFAYLFPWTKLSFDSFRDYTQLWSHVVLIHNLNEASFFGINGSFWSIAVEVQLYLLYPLLVAIVKRFGWRKALWMTGIIEISLRSVGFFHNAVPFWFTACPLYFWFSWSIGAMIADDYLNGRAIFLSQCPLWMWPMMTIVCFFFINALSQFVFLFAALAAGNGIAYFLSKPDIQVAGPRLVFYHLRWVGIVSYSLYLLHQPLLTGSAWVLEKYFPSLQLYPLITFGCLFVLYIPIMSVSWLFYRYVELPSIAAGKWFVRTKMAS